MSHLVCSYVHDLSPLRHFVYNSNSSIVVHLAKKLPSFMEWECWWACLPNPANKSNYEPAEYSSHVDMLHISLPLTAKWPLPSGLPISILAFLSFHHACHTSHQSQLYWLYMPDYTMLGRINNCEDPQLSHFLHFPFLVLRFKHSRIYRVYKAR
jgi:hypothetical protein